MPSTQKFLKLWNQVFDHQANSSRNYNAHDALALEYPIDLLDLFVY